MRNVIRCRIDPLLGFNVAALYVFLGLKRLAERASFMVVTGRS